MIRSWKTKKKNLPKLKEEPRQDHPRPLIDTQRRKVILLLRRLCLEWAKQGNEV